MKSMLVAGLSTLAVHSAGLSSMASECPGGAPHTGLQACGRGTIDGNRSGHSARIFKGCLRVVGTPADSVLALRLDPANVQIIQVDVGNDGSAEFSFDRNGFDCIEVFARGGNDVVLMDESQGAITNTEITTIDGGSGDDRLIGGSGPDTLIGGPGNDFIDGQQGADVALMGSGNDVFQWDPGDGSDTVEGQAGTDIMVFNGAGVDETFNLSADGERLRFTRNLGNIIMDCDDVEQVDLPVLGGADTVVVNNLDGTDVLEVNIDLAATAGGDTGDSNRDAVTVNATDAADIVSVRGSSAGVTVSGLSALVHITTAEAANDHLTVNGLAGDDTVEAADMASGVIALTLNGGPGKDLLTGSGDADLLAGDEGDDTVVGGGDDDEVHLGGGNDRFIWNPGDATDIVEGDDGDDTIEINGGNGAEDFTITADAPRVRFDRISPNPFSIDIGASEHLVLNARDGNDTLACSGNLAALIQITADGGAGDDTLLGGNGADLLRGGDGDDFIDGQGGADTAIMGAGNDVFQWDPGDGSDIVEGQDGTDAMVFNGNGAVELFDLSADGDRLRFTRSVGEIIMDCDGLEQIDLPALGNADTIVVKSLVGTDVVEVNIDLAAVPGGATGDAQPDNIIVAGTEDPDTIDVFADSGAIVVDGLSALVRILGAEPRADLLVVNGLGGADTITAEPDVADLIILQIVNE